MDVPGCRCGGVDGAGRWVESYWCARSLVRFVPRGCDFERLAGRVLGVLMPGVWSEVDRPDDEVSVVAYGEGHDVAFRYEIHISGGFASPPVVLFYVRVWGRCRFARMRRCGSCGLGVRARVTMDFVVWRYAA